MSSYGVPVLLSRWTEDLHTAVVLDGPKAQACAASATEAFTQVRDFIRKAARKGSDCYWPTIDRYQLHDKAVTVRLYYREKNRQFPASRELRLPVRYVLGHYVDDSLECFLPDFDVVFYCPAKRELDRLIEEQVRGCTASMTSRELTAVALPQESEIRVVRIRPKFDVVETETLPETLTQVATPMVLRDRKQKQVRAIDRNGLLDRLHSAVSQSSVIVVGDPGCGKTTLLRTVAHRIQEGARAKAKSLGNTSPPPLVWQTSAEDVIAGMAYLGQWEARLENLISEADSIGAILVFRALIDLVRLGGSGPGDSIASFLDPYLQRGEVRMVGECTTDELQAVKRLLPGFVNHFQIVSCPRLDNYQVENIAQTMFDEARRNHRVEARDGAARLITGLMSRFLPYEAPPRGVVDVTRDLIEREAFIGTDEIVSAMIRRTGLPEIILRDNWTLSVDEVAQSLGKSVIGQSHAVSVAAGVVLRVKAGLCDPNRPIATLLFTGPTGVGKTQLTRTLSEYLFGGVESDRQSSDDHPLIRLDMSEYGGFDGAHRLMVAEDGSVAKWIGRLRRRPMSVLLLDEFEKSNEQVHDLLLSALDEGRLTDPYGRTTSLCGCVIVLTSNVGAKRNSSLGFAGDNEEAVRQQFDKAAREAFRLEFLNRLDEIVAFSPLDRQSTRQIVIKELTGLSNRESLQRHHVELSWTDQCVDQLTEIGFDSQLGARPLQRVIEQRLVSRIAKILLERENSTSTGSDSLSICLDGIA